MIWLLWKDFLLVPRLAVHWLFFCLIVLAILVPVSFVIAFLLQIAQALGVWPYA